MAYLNRVMLIGNLTRDPQLKQLANNNTVADFGLAMSRRFRTADGEDREEVCFVDCAAFGKQADVIGQYCKKGKQLFIDGRLRYDTWEDRQGVKRSKVSVVVDNFQFLGARSDDASSAPDGPAVSDEPRDHREQPGRHGGDTKVSPERSGRQQGRKAAANKPASEQMKFKDADIPF